MKLRPKVTSCDHVLHVREVSGETDLLPGVTGAMGGHSAWLQGLRSPLIKEVNTSQEAAYVTIKCENRTRMAAPRSSS